jgi:nicotinate-nucleotide--dimethylbenzimidazole phosphoribosyltransferase
MAGTSPPPLPSPATVAVFAGDHGVVAEGVTPWPQEVTAQMVATFCAGGAAVNVLARHAGARVVVVDVGVAAPLEDAPSLRRAKVGPGTANLARGPAMTVSEAGRALDVGAGVAAQAVTAGARCLVGGDMGIANTTASAALIAAFTGRPAAEVTGRGTGIDDATWAHKVAVVEWALDRAQADGSAAGGPLSVLASLGGYEIAALAGFVVGGAAARVPVVVDGVVALAGVLAAGALAPVALAYCVAGHRSTEPGASAALQHLGMEPLLDLGLRLGEGTGALLALPLVEAAAKVLREMSTFDAAGVTAKD